MDESQGLTDQRSADDPDLDVVIVGAGFAGLYAVHRLRQLGLRVRAYERGAGVGGTWYWNKYPGCRCDIESIWYSYSFSDELQQEWTWSHRYAAQPEILAYLDYVADRFALRRDIQLETTVTGMTYDAENQIWSVELNEETTVTASFVVMASGFLSDPILPDIPGIDDYKGLVVHTGAWPEEGVDLTGKCVGIIGTGSSAIQSIPIIAQQAGYLYVFQRTPQFAIPAWNGPIAADEIQAVKDHYPELRRQAWEETIGGVPFEEAPHEAKEASPEERDQWLQKTWARGGYLMIASYPDVMFDDDTNAIVGDWVKERIRERVEDPAVAEKLLPSYPFAAKRLCVDTDYFEAYNRDNVALVDLQEAGIERFVEGGVRMTDGSVMDLDVLIFATGFDAGTGAVLRINPVGRGGMTISEKWGEHIAAYLGIMVAGFPNMFLVDGPGSPSVLYNMPPAIEHHVDWIADTISYLREHGQLSIEPEPQSDIEWAARVNEIADQTVYPKANSWYMGANVAGKERSFLAWAGGGPEYFEIVQNVVDHGYRGFKLEPDVVEAGEGSEALDAAI